MKEIFNLVVNLLIFGLPSYWMVKYYFRKKAEKALAEKKLWTRTQAKIESWDLYDELVIDQAKRIKGFIKMAPEGPCFFIFAAIVSGHFTKDDGTPGDLDLSEILTQKEEDHKENLEYWNSLTPAEQKKTEEPNKLRGPRRKRVLYFIRKKTTSKKYNGVDFDIDTVKPDDDEVDDEIMTLERLKKKTEKKGGLLAILRPDHVCIVAHAKNNRYCEAYNNTTHYDLEEEDKVIAITGLVLPEKEEEKEKK